MNKLFTKIAGVALGLTMAIGVGVAVANSNRKVVPAHAADSTSTMTWGGVDTQWSFSDSGSTYLEWSHASTGSSPINASDYRMYSGADLTVKAKSTYSSSVKIKSLAITGYNSNNKNSNYLYYNASTGAKVTSTGTGVTALEWTSSQTSTTGYSKTASFGDGLASVTVARATSGNQIRVTSIVVTYEYTAPSTVEATGMTISPSSATAYAGETVSITPTLTGGVGEYEKTISWTSSNTSIIAKPANSEDGESFTVTPNSVETQTAVTLTGTVVNPGSASADVVITVKPARTLTSITVSGDMTNKTYVKNADWDFAGLSLVGHYSDESSETLGTFPDLIDEGTLTFDKNHAKATVGYTTLVLSNISYGGKTVSGGLTITGITVQNVELDVLTVTSLGLSGSYGDWSGKTVSTDAVYAGNSAVNSGTIQIRGSNNSGIITTTSAGVVSKITFDWGSSTSNGRIVNIYGKSTAYTAVSDLYDNNKQGTLLGTIVKGTSTELSIPAVDRPEYIGIKVGTENAAYLNSVTITWTEPEPVVTELTLSPSDEQTIKVGNSQTFTVGVTGKNLKGDEVSTITYDAVILTSAAIELSEESVTANGGTFTLTAVTAGAAGTLKVTCLGVDSNSVDIYTEEAKTLSKIEVTTSGKTNYVTGNTFDKTNYVVTATYTDTTTAAIQESATWNVLRGESLLSINTVLDNGDKVRVSYTEGGINKTVDITLNFVEAINSINGTIAGDQTVTKSAEDLGLDSAADIDNTPINSDLTITGALGSNQNNRPKYYTPNAIRVYNGNTLTISSTKIIKNIVFNMDSGYPGDVSVNTGTYSLAQATLTGTWTGSATSIVFTHSSSTQWRINNLSITYDGIIETEISNKFYDAQKAVIDFAEYLNDELDGVCVTANYESSAFQTQWDKVADKFEDLFVTNERSLDETNLSVAKQLLSGATANYSGDKLQKAMARYDKIVSESSLDAFMVDGTTPLRLGHSITHGFVADSESIAMIIVIISMVGITAFGGYFFLRKKKHQ